VILNRLIFKWVEFRVQTLVVGSELVPGVIPMQWTALNIRTGLSTLTKFTFIFTERYKYSYPLVFLVNHRAQDEDT
jgi:hypothetical protein